MVLTNTLNTDALSFCRNRTAKKNPNSDGVCNLMRPQDQIEALEALALTDLWGVASRMALRLQDLGIKTPMQLREIESSMLRDRLGVVFERLALELRGMPCHDLVELNPPTKACSHRDRSVGPSSHDTNWSKPSAGTLSVP